MDIKLALKKKSAMAEEGPAEWSMERDRSQMVANLQPVESRFQFNNR